MKKLIYILVLIHICVGTAYAQTGSLTAVKKAPTLDGHSFPTLNYFQSSFITTNLTTNLGVGTTSPIRIGGLQIGDKEIYTFEGQILFLNLRVQYQQRFNPWLAMYVNYSLTGRVGTSMSTILADGVNTINGGSIGWLIRIKQSKKFNLAGSVELVNLIGSFINVSQYFEDIINDVPNPSVYNQVPSLSIGGGLQGAWAINPMFGMQFQGNLAYGESFERGVSEAFYAVGLLGDVDFMPKQKVPIGFALGYTLTSAPAIVMNGGGNAGIFSARLGYTGASEFQLGLQYSYYKIHLQSVDDNPSVSNFALVMELFF